MAEKHSKMSTWLCKARGCPFLKMDMISIKACFLHLSTNFYKVMEGWEELQGRLSKSSNMYFSIEKYSILLNKESRGYGFTRTLSLNSIAGHLGICWICTVLVISYGLWVTISIVVFDAANMCQKKQKSNMKQWNQRCICFLLADKVFSPSHLSVWSADNNLWNLWWS